MKKTHINLLTEDIAGDRFLTKKLIILSCLFILIGLIIMSYTIKLKESNSLKKENASLIVKRDILKGELKDLTTKIGEIIKDNKATKEKEKEGIERIKEILKTRYFWSQILREIGQIIPEGVWLTDTESIEIKKGNRAGEKGVRFVGFAHSQSDITNFISSLEGSEKFNNIELIYTRGRNGTKRELINFEIMAGIDNG
ncbi:MAG: PilN domain-containing protein [Nitrospirota bacterium]